MKGTGRLALIGAGREGLTLSVPSRDAGAFAAVPVMVKVTQPGLEAELVVVLSPEYGPTVGDLADFFAGMARDWRGWKGERTFESVDQDLKITAAHDGHVRLRVAITDGRFQVGRRLARWSSTQARAWPPPRWR